MRIRTQLILASFVLAVLPLAAIVVWTHHSSREALEDAQRRETARLTRQMDRRLASIRQDLEQRLAVVSALPLQQPGSAAGANDPAVVGNIVTAMGDAASLVDSLEFHPVPAPTPRAVPVPRASVADATPEPSQAEVPAEAPPAPPQPPQVAMGGGHPPITNVEIAPIVIDIPPTPDIPRYVMPAEQRELVRQIGRLAAKFERAELSPEERAQVQEELEALRKELLRTMSVSQAEFERRMEETRGQRESYLEEARIARERARESRRRQASVEATAPVAATAAAPPVAVTETVPATTRVEKVGKGEKPAKADKSETKVVRRLTEQETQKLRTAEKQIALIFGRDFHAPVKNEGAVVGQISARVRPEEVIQRVLGAATDDSDELPFAIDREGNIYTRNPAEKQKIEQLGIAHRLREGKSLAEIEGWIVSVKTDAQSGLRIGVARPVGENLTELKKTAARNFFLGLGLILFAVVGIVPLANHLTRDVQVVTEGAQRIAQGDLMTRLPVESKNEFGQLATAFNRMAEDLSVQQQRLLEQERARKEQELQQRLMAVEYERKSFELEEARRFQLSMLPKEVPRHDGYDVAVYTRTATEVGGDYYDFHIGDRALAVTIGDATGHGAKAGTMVTVVKTLFAGYASGIEPSEFLRDAAEKIKRMELGRMSMALALARFAGPTLTLASAGMPPVLIHRGSSGAVEEIALAATPLGTLGTDYAQTEVPVAAGDTVLFMTDGFPELLNDAGQQVGYAAAAEAFAAAATSETAEAVIATLTEVVRRWHGDLPPNDDVTFVAVRVK